MSLPYSLRLACLCLAAFFFVQLTIGVAVLMLSPAIIRRAKRLEAAQAAMLLFVARLVPALSGAAFVLLICLPSYLMFESEGATEQVGAWCVGGALICLLSWGYAIARTARAAACSVQYLHQCRRQALAPRKAGDPAALWVLNDCSPGLALLGIFQPRFVVSARLVQVLPAEEFSAALRHEQAHWSARDNLKRLLFLLTPCPLPFSAFGRLEREWARFAEWAADDRAVEGDPRLSLFLAAALVRVARLGLKPTLSPLTSTLVGSRCDLAERVQRLLDVRPSPPRSALLPTGLITTGGVLLAITVLPIMTDTSTLNWFHLVLESLMH